MGSEKNIENKKNKVGGGTPWDGKGISLWYGWCKIYKLIKRFFNKYFSNGM